MGRLYWKFFFIFFSAQIVTTIGIGVMMWLSHPDHNPEHFPHHGEDPYFPCFSSSLYCLFISMDRPPFPLHPGGPPPHSLFPPLMPIAAGCAVSFLFAALLAWYLAKPIRGLRLAFEAVAGGNLAMRVGVSMGQRKDELADLGKDFDRMATHLQALLDSQHRLLHDVSHELRSPLARLQAASDLMRQQPERAGEFAKRIERDTAQMDKLVGELLTLARLDAGITGDLTEEIDLYEIIAQIADDAHFEAITKGCTVACELSSPVSVIGNGDLLYRALENVIRNAVRYSPKGGRIVISAKRDGTNRNLCITVVDQGAGVPETNLETIFEPFFRCRTSDTFSGYGLGLAITKRIIEAHQGHVSAANHPTGGLIIRFILPTNHGSPSPNPSQR
ncbi:Histidine kinase [Gammaproteobacteria bacterium]